MTPTRTAMVLTKVMNSKVMTLLNTRAMWPYNIPIGIAVFVLLWYSPAWLTVALCGVSCVVLAARVVERRLANRRVGSEPAHK